MLTSNLGQDILINNATQEGPIPPETKTKVMDVVRHAYAPEFLNRIDEFIIFQRLSREAIRDIVDIRLKELQARLDDRRIKLDVDPEAKEWLSTNGYDYRYGARPLNRLINKKLLNPLAVRLIRGEIRGNEVARVRVKEGVKELEVLTNREVQGASEKTANADGKKE